MKRPLFLLLAAVVLTFIVLFALSVALKKPKTTDTTKPTATTTSSNLYDLVQMGGNKLCTWNIAKDGAKTSGVVYVTDGKFAADFQTVAQGSGINSHMYGDGTTVYSWSDFADLPGVTMPYTNFKTPTNKDGLIYQKVTYTCSPWTPETLKFKLPQGIKFNAS